LRWRLQWQRCWRAESPTGKDFHDGFKTSFSLFLGVNAIGLAVWLTISVINNCRGFGGSVAAVGATMSMAGLKHPPAIDTPLLSRATGLQVLHRAALLVVLALQVVAAACWTGCWQLLVVGDPGAARPWLNLGLSAFTAFLLAMHPGGLWFAYWSDRRGCS
jgi:hypothetical protein